MFHLTTFFNSFKVFSFPNKEHIVYGTGFPAGYVKLRTIKEGAQFCVNVAHFAFAFTIAFTYSIYCNISLYVARRRINVSLQAQAHTHTYLTHICACMYIHT